MMRSRRRHSYWLAAATSLGLLAGCSSSHHSSSNSPPATAPGSASSSQVTTPPLAQALPAAPGTTVLSTVAGTGDESLAPLQAGGTLNFSIACSKGSLKVVRTPDISFTLTCNGQPQGVQLKDAANNAQPLAVQAASGVSWALNVGAQ